MTHPTVTLELDLDRVTHLEPDDKPWLFSATTPLTVYILPDEGGVTVFRVPSRSLELRAID